MTIIRTLSIAASGTVVCLAGLAIAPPASASPDTVVVTCTGRGVVQPKVIDLACADASVLITNITWKSWTDNGAKGTGTLAWNTCLLETCAGGIVQKYRVRITLGGVASAPGVSAFTAVTLAFPKGGPAAAETATYTIDNPQR